MSKTITFSDQPSKDAEIKAKQEAYDESVEELAEAATLRKVAFDKCLAELNDAKVTG